MLARTLTILALIALTPLAFAQGKTKTVEKKSTTVEKTVEVKAVEPVGKVEAPLSEDERRILDIGLISDTRYIIGGILGTYPIGLGLGHAVQGRYMDRGWIFTVGELASLAVLISGLSSSLSDSFEGRESSSGNGALVLGLIGYVGFRVFEIIDVWATPIEHNRRYRAIKARQDTTAQMDGFLAPTQDGGKFVLQLSF